MSERKLDSSPTMLLTFARAGAALLPGASNLPFVPGGTARAPDLTLVREDVTIDRPKLAAYDRVCGFPLRDALPATYPHILAFPMHLALMTDGRFPLPPIGLIHIHNRITQHRPIGADERLTLRVWSTDIEPHPRGRQFALRTEARVGDELVWEDTSTNLRRGSGQEDASAPSIPSAEDLPAVATWTLKGDLGRRYGAVSGDMNPIHLHSLGARLFGFPSAIAHGMWTKARCLAALENRLPSAFTVEAAFKRPILLPAKVEFAERSEASGLRFGVRDASKGTPHLDGQLN
jgi:acyl dehydratase